MKIRELNVKDTSSFCELIVDMYSHLDNLEWFTPMPYDYDNVKSMIENPRFYILGAFEDEKLVGVSSLDYKCGKLLNKIDFAKYCDISKLVEVGFTMVHSKYRGKKIMQKLLESLLEKLKKDGFENVFSKVHVDNIASNKSCINKGFNVFCKYNKEVNKKDFIYLSSQDFFSELGKENARKTLKKNELRDSILVDYNILIRKV